MIIFNLYHKPDFSSKTILIKSHTASSCKDWPPLKRLSPGLSILIFWLGRVYIPGNPKLGTLQNWNVSVNFHTWAAASTCTELIFPISAEDLTLTFWTQKFTDLPENFQDCCRWNVFECVSAHSHNITDQRRHKMAGIFCASFRYRKFTSVCYPHLGELDLVV